MARHKHWSKGLAERFGIDWDKIGWHDMPKAECDALWTAYMHGHEGRACEKEQLPGNKTETDSAFLHGFVGAAAPLTGVKMDRGKKGPNDVLMITGATISSRAVIRIINNAIARWQPLMDAYREEVRL